MKRIVVLLLGCEVVLAAGTIEDRTVKWSELAQHVTGARVSVTATVGDVVHGKVISVEAEAMSIRTGKRTQTYPRASVRAVTVVRRKGPWRAIGTAIGIAAGGIAGKTQSRAALVAVAGGGVLGYFAGRSGDRREVRFNIAPE